MSCEADAMSQCCSTARRRARKQHECCACEIPILPGDRYVETTGVWDGQPSRFRHCLRCFAIVDALSSKSDVECVQLDLRCGDTWDDPPPEVARLAFLTHDEIQQLATEPAP